MLDGDDVRQNLCAGLGFSPEDRRENVRRIAWVADILSRNDVITFAAAVSPYRSMREEARARMGNRFVEVHVRASVDECERRDVKGLYQRARAGEIQGFTGVSDPYEEPTSPELLLETETETVEQSADKLIAYVEERLAGATAGGRRRAPRRSRSALRCAPCASLPRSSRSFGGAEVTSESSSRCDASVISSTARWKASSFACEGFVKPLILRTNWSEASCTSSSVAGGSKL